jgi:hypothetical protein
VRWTLTPGRWAKWRAREWEIAVENSGDPGLVEREVHSGIVLTWTVVDAPEGRSVVKLELAAHGPDGLRGMGARSRTNRLGRLFGDVLLELRNRFPAG